MYDFLMDTMHKEHFCNINFPGYNTYHTRNKKNQNDGIIVLYKKKLMQTCL